MKRYMVTLTAEERRALQALIAASKASARKLTHARILLKADRGPEGPGWNDEQITEGLGVGHATVDRVRQSRRAGTGGSDGGVGVCRHRFRGDRASDAQKNELKPWLKKQGCIPPKENAEFVWKREDVLDVYKRPYDPNRPMVCLDETSKQLIGETRIPVPAMPGREARYDHEYQRNGTANLFMVFEPLAGKRHVQVTERRTMKD